MTFQKTDREISIHTSTKFEIKKQTVKEIDIHLNYISLINFLIITIVKEGRSLKADSLYLKSKTQTNVK